jgi:hypothetical protein
LEWREPVASPADVVEDCALGEERFDVGGLTGGWIVPEDCEGPE